MTSKSKILIVGSSVKTFVLKDGQKQPTGYYFNELAIPAQALVEAGYEIILVTPLGNEPVVDRHSLDASHFEGSEERFQKARDFVNMNTGLRNPRTIRSVIEEGLDNYIGVFLAGGHPPMIDLMEDPDLGTVLRHFHAESKPTALLCHAPIAVTAAMKEAKRFRQALVDGDTLGAMSAAHGWQYAGYRMTVFSNEEEMWAEENVLHGRVPFYVVDALRSAGAILELEGLFVPNVVQDRELITGQNPPSDHLLAAVFIRALDLYMARGAAALANSDTRPPARPGTLL
jgi:putative intracellular protease/amidase